MREYRVTRQIGIGGMGRVYEARADLAFDMSERVAIKVILGEPDDLAARQMFAEEAMVSLRMNHEHPNLVTVFDFGQTDDGEPFFVMQYVDGSTVRDLHKVGPLALPFVRRVAHKVLQALAYLHGKDVLHRDVSARNILIGRDGTVKLSDLGLVKRISGSRSHQFIGTPSYGPPESILHAETRTKASDVYSLGAVLYELVYGEPPYGKGNQDQVWKEMCHNRDPMERLTELPEDVNALIAGMIPREPSARLTVAEALLTIDLGAMATKQEIGAVVDERAPAPEPEIGLGTMFSVRGAVLRKAAPGPKGLNYKPADRGRPPWLPWVIGSSVVSILVGLAIGVLVMSTALRAAERPGDASISTESAARSDYEKSGGASPSPDGFTSSEESFVPTREESDETAATPQ